VFDDGVLMEEEKREKMNRDLFFEFPRRKMYGDDCEFLGFLKQIWWNLLQ